MLEVSTLKPNGQCGVAVPSANKFGQLAPTSADHVRSEFAGMDAADFLVLEGGTAEVDIESTIVDVSRIEQGMGPALLRPGHISAAQIEAVLGGKLLRPDQTATRVSG